jgi:hypothetical protein
MAVRPLIQPPNRATDKFGPLIDDIVKDSKRNLLDLGNPVHVHELCPKIFDTGFF